MRNVSIQELEADTDSLISEVEAGQRLTLIRGGKAVADIVPHTQTAATEESRAAAFREMLAVMNSGLDLGGKPFSYEERHER